MPTRTRPKSGISIPFAFPTITYSTYPFRSSSTPTCRPVSFEISDICRASSCETIWSGGTRRVPNRSIRLIWFAFNPCVNPVTLLIKLPSDPLIIPNYRDS